MRLRKPATWAAVTALLAAAAVAVPAVAGEKYKGFERGDALITPKELKGLMDAQDPKLVLIGVVKAGLTGSFTRGHIPGAFSVWRPDYTTAAGEEFPFGGMMKGPAEFQKLARSLGIDEDSKVVIYDEQYDATRLWWAFYLYGKTDVRILDGGYEGWKAAGYDTDMGAGADRDKRQGNFVAKLPHSQMVWGMDKVWRAKTDGTIQLWDTREPDEWTGETLMRDAYRKGRIPWATFLSWKDFRKNINGKPTEFKTADEIARVIAEHGIDENKDQLFYCQAGVRTTTHIFALYLMGWDMDRLHNYDGSWIEWSFHEKNPVETGD